MNNSRLDVLLNEDQGEVDDKFRLLVEHIPLVTYIDAIDDSSSALYMSPQIEDMLGYPVQTWIDDSDLFMKLLHPDDVSRIATLVKRTNSTGELFRAEYRLQARDGRVVWFHDEAVHRLRVPGYPPCYLGYMADITTRKDFENRLRGAERDYRNLIEQLPAVAYIATIEAKQREWHYVSPRATSLIGFRPDELRSDSRLWFRQIFYEDRDRVLAAEEKLRREGSYDVEYRLLTSSGKQVWFHDKATALLSEGGESVRVQGVMLDVSDRHRESLS